jgi:hypothetical protein
MVTAMNNVTVRLRAGYEDEWLGTQDVQNDIDERMERVLKSQQRDVPVRTGNLQRSLEIQKLPDGKRRVGSFDVDYAAAVENGHETASGYFVQPQPFIRPSIEAAK